MAQFQPGASGNPAGRPKGAVGGRSLALATLDKMLARASNRAMLEKALEKNFRDDPVKFFRTMVMPLMPKEAKGPVEHDGVVTWRSLVTVTAPEAGKVGGREPKRLEG